MKKVVYSIKKCCLVLMISQLSIGCEKFFETAPSTQVSDVDAFGSITTARSILLGIYSNWKRGTGGFGTGLHGIFINRDVMGPDVQVAGSWWLNESNYSSYTQEQGRVTVNWTALYSSINNCNIVIANINSVPGTQAEKDQVMGEALALRGYSYLELVQIYAPPYRVGAAKKGLPIYLTPTTAATKGNPRSTVQQVYTQILADLNRAKSLMTQVRSDKSYINTNVIDGILARVHLNMGNYAPAATSANAARQGYPLMSQADWVSGFNNKTNVEWIWCQDPTAQENGGNGGVAMQFDLQSGNNEATLHASNALVSLYSNTDIRKTRYYMNGQTGYWATNKIRNGNPSFTGDFPYIRSTEMYLIEAEALARTGSTASAQTLLLAVQQRADAGAVASGNTGQALIAEIIREKRKEFFAEGIYFLDMLRTGIPLVRDASHPAQVNIPADNWRFIWQIPEQEFLVNTSLNISTDQNPSTGPIL